jgi:hypothetical protein
MAGKGKGGGYSARNVGRSSGTPKTPTTPTTPGAAPRGQNAVPQAGFTSPPVTQETYSTPVGSTQLEFSRGVSSADADYMAGYVDDEWRKKRPTNTINPPRPRSLAAAYNVQEELLYICFRGTKQANGWADGAIYEYQNVSPDEWREVRNTVSTGRYINSTLNHHPYTRID